MSPIRCNKPKPTRLVSSDPDRFVFWEFYCIQKGGILQCSIFKKGAMFYVSIAKRESNHVLMLIYCCLQQFSMLHVLVIHVATHFSTILLQENMICCIHIIFNCVDIFEVLNHL
jgi:hypothetical protein